MKRWLLLLSLTILWGCDQPAAIKLGWAPGDPDAEISKALLPILGSRFNVESSQHPNDQDLLRALQNGAVDLAIIEQPSAPVPNVSVVTALYPSVLHVLVHENRHSCDSPLVLADLIGSGSVYSGAKGSAGYRLLMALSDAQLLPAMEDMQLLDSPFGVEPDVHIDFGGILSYDARSRLPGYCLASLGDVENLGRGAWVEGISYRYPHLKPFVLPAGLYPSLSASASLTLAVQSLLVARQDIESDDVYDIAQLVMQNANQLETIYPLAGDSLHNTLAGSRLNLPMHPGAQRFRDRDAPTMLERYAELLAFAITFIVAITSAGVAVVRIRRRAKKDRLDVYFEKLVAARATLAAADNAIPLHSEVVDLQAAVTKLVVEEQLLADASFVAFLELSNQILKEINATVNKGE
jgi:hypothetical protein